MGGAATRAFVDTAGSGSDGLGGDRRGGAETFCVAAGAGAVAGVLAAILFRRSDPMPPRKRYSWEDEEAAVVDEELELPRPAEVPVLWQRPIQAPGQRVIPFGRRDPEDSSPTVH